MAAQMAQLLAGSDLDELRLLVRRWVDDTPEGPARAATEALGGRLLELKAALAAAPVAPTHAELEEALTLMLRLAAQRSP